MTRTYDDPFTVGEADNLIKDMVDLRSDIADMGDFTKTALDENTIEGKAYLLMGRAIGMLREYIVSKETN